MFPKRRSFSPCRKTTHRRHCPPEPWSSCHGQSPTNHPETLSCAEDRRIYQTTLRLVKVVTQTQTTATMPLSVRSSLPPPPSPAPRVLAVRPALAGCRAVCWPAARSTAAAPRTTRTSDHGQTRTPKAGAAAARGREASLLSRDESLLCQQHSRGGGRNDVLDQLLDTRVTVL